MIATNVIVLAPAAVFCVMTGQYTPIIISIAFSGVCWWILLRTLRALAEKRRARKALMSATQN
ncbi:hypothetical protein [Streptomyces halobius]|uniref:Uncharacterized protein n=1 Tax=Streptomyces halobius TaxID=2879846 RepID=A0ABY4LZ69_9ACTN|nr:hypothetical protein [Streptomyces halobius]UQA90765.1 hypothetical protein K9S39_01675 [Streptomyces halobius]